MIAAQPHSPTGLHHAVVWIDHHEARIYRFESEVSEAARHVIRDHRSPAHLHHKANSVGSGHVTVSHAYLESVAMEIMDAKAILIVGPSGAKHELYKHIQRHHPLLLNAIVGVETLDHPDDGPLLAHAAKTFRDAARTGRPYSPGNN